MPLNDRSSRLRAQVLVPNGGWLGEGVVLVSDLLGLWDVFVLMALFVLVWVVVRTTSCEISMILGMIFDLGIPLQYQNDDSLARTHQRHLSDYWPIFVIASVVEVAGFLFFHPDLFTLCVCLKTTGCLALWLSRRSDGSKVVLGSSGPNSFSAQGPPKNPPIVPLDPHQGPFDPKLPDPRAPHAASLLRQIGYDPETIEGMIVHLKRRSKENDVVYNLREWTKAGIDNPQKMAERKKKYTKRARENREAWARLQKQGNGARLGGAGSAATTKTGAPGGKSKAAVTGNSAMTGGTIVLPKEAMDQIWDAIKGDSKKTPQAKEATFNEIRQAIDAQDVGALTRRLERIGIHTADPRVGGKVYNELGEAEVKRRYERLVRPVTDGGIEMPRHVADVMMCEMIAQPSKKAANDLYASWSKINKMPPGRERGLAKQALLQRYGERAVKAHRGQDLVMPWTVDSVKRKSGT